MGKYVLAYRGGGMAATPEEQEKVMAAWGAWLGQLGSALTDMGNPFGESAALASDGSAKAAEAGLTGYSILQADSLAAATDLAKGCPVLAHGGQVEIYEALDVM
jgi:hypothetical protein